MRGPYKYKTYKYEKWLMRNKFTQCEKIKKFSSSLSISHTYTGNPERLSVSHMLPIQLVKRALPVCYHLLK